MSNNGFPDQGTSNKEHEFTYEEICLFRDFLQSRIKLIPKVGIICGTGLSCLAELITNPTQINFKDIPNFPRTTAPGHSGIFTFGYISRVPVVCMQGRFHYYEGHSLATCIMPVRLMKLLGISYLIASNAVGGLNPNFKVGDIMLQKDHFNLMGLTGSNPLRGSNDLRWGSRFVSMVDAYDPVLLQKAKDIALEIEISDKVHEGVYFCAAGPTYETIAECKALIGFGVDCVGMSSVHEVTAARHCGIKCLVFSLITNICSVHYDKMKDITEEEVCVAGELRKDVLKAFVKRIFEYIENIPLDP